MQLTQYSGSATKRDPLMKAAFLEASEKSSFKCPLKAVAEFLLSENSSENI